MSAKTKLEVTKLFLELARQALAEILDVPVGELALVLDVAPEKDSKPMLKAAAELATDTYPGRFVIGDEDTAALTIWHSQDMK